MLVILHNVMPDGIHLPERKEIPATDHKGAPCHNYRLIGSLVTTAAYENSQSQVVKTPKLLTVNFNDRYGYL